MRRAILLAAIILSIAACGSDDEGGDSTDPPAAATTIIEATTTAAPETTSTAAPETAAAETTPETEAEAEVPSGDDVPWENYDDSVRERIVSLYDAGDCAGLQNEFDLADANDDTQRNRVGEGNADLMVYLDELLTAADCY